MGRDTGQGSRDGEAGKPGKTGPGDGRMMFSGHRAATVTHSLTSPSPTLTKVLLLTVSYIPVRSSETGKDGGSCPSEILTMGALHFVASIKPIFFLLILKDA